MATDVSAELNLLTGDFETALAMHLQDFRSDGDTYGYAILLGEDIGMCNAIAVTSKETDVAAIGDANFANDFRYIPDEWQHWHQDAFRDFNSKLDEVYALFRQRCPQTQGVYQYNEHELKYLQDVYDMYLNAAAKCVKDGAFGDVWYRVIWISDCGRSIIADSFYQLNQGRAIDEAAEYFE